MLKYPKIKLRLLITLLVVAFLLFLYFYLRVHSYSDEYMVNDVKVVENYDKKNKFYTLRFILDDFNFEVVSEAKYSTKRELVKNISVEKDNDSVCLNIEATHVTTYNICKKGEEYYYKDIDNFEEFKEKETYENIKINDLNNNKYLLWDYDKFICLGSKNKSNINLFSTDIYNLNLIYQHNDLLLVPDYNEEFKFNKINIINAGSGKVDEMKLRYEVYFDSYFMGGIKNKVYLYDFKNSQEYYLDLKKEEIYKSKNQIYVNNEWKNVTNNALKTEKPTFSTNTIINYELNDGTLYANFKDNKFKVSNKEVSKIIKTTKTDVYYLVKDTLYYFNPYVGKKALLKYSEWEFNNNNMIFVF